MMELFPALRPGGRAFRRGAGARRARRWRWRPSAATSEYTDGRRPGGVHFETDPRAGRAAPRFHHQRADAGSGHGRGAGLRRRPRRTWRAAWSARSATRTRAFARTICGCCARCGSRRGWASRSSRRHSRRSASITPLIRSVSAERVRDELVRILTEGGARRGFEMLDASGLLDDHPARSGGDEGSGAAAGVSSGGRRLDPHAADAGEAATIPPPTLALGALLHDVGKPPTFRVAERIRFDGHVEEGVENGARRF